MSFVYGLNNSNERKLFWDNLLRHARLVKEDPWAVLGDFNAIKSLSGKKGGSTHVKAYKGDLNNLCNNSSLDDMRFMGSFFTWNNNSEGQKKIECKLDRDLVNKK